MTIVRVKMIRTEGRRLLDGLYRLDMSAALALVQAGAAVVEDAPPAERQQLVEARVAREKQPRAVEPIVSAMLKTRNAARERNRTGGHKP